MLYLPATPAGPEDRRRPTARASSSPHHSLADPKRVRSARNGEGEGRENRSKVPSLYSKPRAFPLRIEQPGSATSSSAGPAKPSVEPAGAKAQPFRSENSNLNQGVSLSVQGHQFQLRGSFRACGEWTAMLKGAAFAAPAAPGGTPAQRNLLPRG
jgi:hypothetical protein